MKERASTQVTSLKMAVFRNLLHLCQYSHTLTQSLNITLDFFFSSSPLIEGKGIVSEETAPGVSRSPPVPAFSKDCKKNHAVY